MVCGYNQRSKTLTFGAFPPVDSIRLNLHMRVSSWDPHLSAHMRECGNLPLPNVASLCRWSQCWTTDRLARQGLPHPAQCPLYDQEEETINHLLVSCVFAQQFWFYLLQHFGIQQLCPHPSDYSFD